MLASAPLIKKAWPLPSKRPREADAQALVQVIARYAREPVNFAEAVLGIHLDPWQCDVLDALQENESVAIRSSHGVGKTTTLGVAALHFLTTRPIPKVVMTAPTFNKQVKDILFAEIHKWWRPVAGRWPWFYSQFELLQTRMQHVQMANEWFAVGIASAKAVNLEGYHTDHVLIVFDEAKGIPRPTWEAVYGARTTHQAKLLVASTPGGPTGEFFKVFTQLRTTWKHTFIVHPSPLRDLIKTPEVMGQDPVTHAPVRGRYSKTGGTYYSDRPRKEWIDLCREEWGEDSPVFIARVIGNFPTLVGDNLVPYAWLSRAEDMEQGMVGHRVVSCDVARFGRDRTTFLVLDGGTALHAETVARVAGESTAPEVETVGVGPDPKRPLYRATVVTADICQRLRQQFDCETIVVDDSVTGDVPVIIRRQGRWTDVVPMASLHKKDSRIYRKHSGMEVWSGTGWTPILYSRRHRVSKPIYDVVTTDGRTKVTGDHSLMVGGVERRAQDLSAGEVIDTLRIAPGPPAGMLAEDLAWVLGLFAAEGSLSYSRRTQHLLARIANSNLGLLLRAQSVLEATFCQARGLTKPWRGVYYALKLADEATRFIERWAYTTVRLRTWIRGAGRTTEIHRFKKVPIQVLNGPVAVKQAWLDGYLAGDGSLDRGRWKVDSIDLTLLAGVQILWESLGYQTSVGVRSDKLNVTTLRSLTGRPGWSRSRRGIDGAVKHIRPLGVQHDYVYDLETGSHTFVAGLGFLVHHNTGLGGGVADDLLRRGESVIPLNFGASPTDKPQTPEDRQWRERRHLTDTLFVNLKAQLGWILRGAFERAEIALALLPRAFAEALIAQTSLVKVEYDAKGRLRLVDPDEQDPYAEAAGNVEGKKSPDHFHALLLGWWVASGAYRGLIPRAGAVVPKGISVLGEPSTQVGRIMSGSARGTVGGQAAQIERWTYHRR